MQRTYTFTANTYRSQVKVRSTVVVAETETAAYNRVCNSRYAISYDRT